MAVFTPVYAIWPVLAWPVPGAFFFVAALGWSVFLAVRAAKLIKFAGGVSNETNAYDARISKGMTIVSSIQGALIVTSVVVLALFGQYVWILPVVVLIVGLHFFPMPAIFGRTIDYYLGGFMLIIAGTGFYLASQSGIDWQVTSGVTGFGAALVTSAFGLYIVRAGNTALTRTVNCKLDSCPGRFVRV
ncbi:hypothetical protein [Cryobacterium sp. PH31-L1]|uniref:hypothetical protein n=1 Tax=Cryobacterium sp. PH31-L1 TaxID=3046199 RepID=UPI0024BAACF2|nr:hypothetical protein [Cryobacterium sp. PH31-L1]MDJ0376267.1 hypothetical protein [Cryobacterium sp. PH31-L1]